MKIITVLPIYSFFSDYQQSLSEQTPHLTQHHDGCLSVQVHSVCCKSCLRLLFSRCKHLNKYYQFAVENLTWHVGNLPIYLINYCALLQWTFLFIQLKSHNRSVLKLSEAYARKQFTENLPVVGALKCHSKRYIRPLSVTISHKTRCRV